EPEAPATEQRVEDRYGVEAAVVERPVIALCEADVAWRPVPARIPAPRGRRSVPSTRRRWSIPVRRRTSGRWSTVPAEPVRSGRWRRAVIGSAEAVRCVPRTTPLRAATVVETALHVWRRGRSTVPRAARTTG